MALQVLKEVNIMKSQEDIKRAADIVYKCLDVGHSVGEYHHVQRAFIEFFSREDPSFDEREFKKACSRGLIR